MKLFSLSFDSKNYTLDDFDLHDFYYYNKIIITVTFFVATMIYWPLIYVVLTQSPKRMKFYSMITAYELSGSYIFTVLIFIAQPCFVFPYKGAYLTGFIQVGEAGNPLMFFSVILSIVFIFHGVSSHLLFRLGSLYTNEHTLSFFSKPKKLNSVLVPVLIILLGLTISGFASDQPEGLRFRNILISEHSYFQQFFELHPHAMGYHDQYSSHIEFLFLAVVSLGIFGLPLLILIYHFFYRRLRYFQKNLSSSRQKWHVMYLKAILAQGGGVIFYLLIPLINLCVAFLFPFQKATIIGSTSPLIASQYIIVAALTRIYFIKPYYSYFIKHFNNFFGIKVQKSSIVTNGNGL